MKEIIIVTIQAIVYTVIVAVLDKMLFNHIHKVLIITVFISSYIDLAVQRLMEGENDRGREESNRRFKK